MTGPDRRLILVVDADASFVEDARLLLQGQRVLSARSAEEAVEIAAGGRVDLVLLGPSFSSESAVAEASSIRAADPTVLIVLAASIITNRILIGAMRAGIADVLETPLTTRKVAEVLERLSVPGLPATDVAASPTTPAPEASETVRPHEPVFPEPVRPVTDPVVKDGPLVTISFEAESETSTPVSFLAATDGPAVVPPSGAIDEPAAPEEAPDPAAWRIPLPEAEPTLPVPPEVVVPGRAAGAPVPLTPLPPAPPTAPQQVVPAPAAEAPPPLEVALAPEPPLASPPPFAPPSAESPVVIRPDDTAPTEVPRRDREYPPPPSSPPPLTRDGVGGHGVRRASPVDLEAIGLLPADGRPRARSGEGRVVVVMAGKGGSGKTITATNLALALTFQSGEDTVVLVDADIQFGDVALMLQLDPTRTLIDAVDRRDELSDARLDAMLLRHESGLRVLPAPLLPTSETEIPAKGIVEVIERLRGMYAHVVVDTPPIFDEHLRTIIESADEVLAVVDMDLPSVKNAKIALDSLRTTRYPMDRVRLVVNRVNAKARLDLVELERSLGLRVAGSIPSDRLVPQSVNEGIPVVALSPRSRVARSFHALAQMLTAEDHQPHRR
jgi:MinD-like ATPase involved in chromosome partitioning or flagellar assembly